ncbi:MAG: type IV toxin-antitoxin system AbiEi family antitoxin domain-containing protein [Bacillales bacterium]|nr:type IV toxin-antitoxin system AbiEi family antitoxin domain-containing protein [Bacillales bacterium]MDY6003352.1 type IV toxin-antitoxin system AbiEi family antitoxin domain-containing protein [Bacilli bacterium]
MLDIEKIIQIAKENNGIVTSSDVTKLGISRMVLKYLVEQNKLIKLDRGVYGLPQTRKDIYFDEQNRYKKGIYFSLSALYLLGYVDEYVDKLYLAFPQTYNTTKAKNRGIICMNQAPSNYEVGAIDIKTSQNNIVRVYCIERTLCELIRDNEIPKSIIKQSFIKYFRNSDANIDKLKAFAKMFNCENKINTIIDLLI